ncbi:MAG: hypothetical protein JW751_09840 [Polyangiaceae bacterium]|nr:hypothetical protein [Polyangiaceae bacterium]
MKRFTGVKAPELPGVKILIEPPDTLLLSGTITLKDANERLGPFFREVHDAVLADEARKLTVDVSGLSFVNSSAIRLFIDWTTWVKNEGNARRYALHFRIDRSVTWQRTSFAALSFLAKDAVVIEQKE